jgi:hypothetical protein
MALSFSGYVSVLKSKDGVFYIGFIECDTVIQDGPKPTTNPAFKVTHFSANVLKTEFSDLDKIKEHFKQHRSEILQYEVKPLQEILSQEYTFTGEPLSLEMQTSQINGQAHVGVARGKIMDMVQQEQVMFQPSLVVEHTNKNRREVFDPGVGKFS